MRNSRTALCVVIAGATIMSTGPVTSVQAQSASEEATVEALKKAIEQRDTLIRDLLHRVERLERSDRDRRVAIERPASLPNGRGASRALSRSSDSSDRSVTARNAAGTAIDLRDGVRSSDPLEIAQAPSPSGPGSNAAPA